MDYFGYAYFAERPRRIEDLMVPHPIEKEHPFRIVTEIQLPAIDYENFITDMLADRQFIEDHGRRCKKSEVWGLPARPPQRKARRRPCHAGG